MILLYINILIINIKIIIKALKHMHEKGICHRDIKLENTLLDKDYVLKICDLGMSSDITKP